MAKNMLKLSESALGLSLGIINGVFTFILSVIPFFYGQGSKVVRNYFGWIISGIPALIIGTLVAFITGFIFGYLLVWIYNKLA